MNSKIIVLGGGCFWGLEDLIKKQPGVIDTCVGYAGGVNKNPTYQNHPGHAEVVKVAYNPNETTLEAILEYFFKIHDPTTLNCQGNDIGESYRSVVFYDNPEEEQTINKVIGKVNESSMFANPVVTYVIPFTDFYPAEEYHQDYLDKNPGGYTCHFERKLK
jgi:peptide-methionine (S)-S-oxide reductase